VNQNRLSNMEPFNDVFFKSCFYNSFFPVVRHFSKSNMPFLIRDQVVYERTRRGYLDADYVFTEPFEMQLAAEGIGMETLVREEGLPAMIYKAIDAGRPAIVWIDPFYSSIRPDEYRKKHAPHALLVFGYDKTLTELHVMEHKHRDNLGYEPRTMPASDLVEAYQGYLERLNRENISGYFEFYLKEPHSSPSLEMSGQNDVDYAAIYWKNWMRLEPDVSNGYL